MARADQLRERRAGPGAGHVSHQVATEGEPHADGRRDRALAIGAHQLVGPSADVRGPRQATGTRHLQIYSTSTDEEQLLSDLHMDGAVTFSDQQPPLVVFQGLSANRAGYFAHFHTTTTTRTTADGTEVTVTVRMRNDAPDGPPSQLLGLPGDGPIGQFGVEMDVYLPPAPRC